MEGWKRALVIGAFGAGAYLMITNKKMAGAVVAGLGVAVLAAEYPEKFEHIWENAPDYIEKGTQVLQMFAQYSEKFAGRAAEYGREAASTFRT